MYPFLFSLSPINLLNQFGNAMVRFRLGGPREGPIGPSLSARFLDPCGPISGNYHVFILPSLFMPCLSDLSLHLLLSILQLDFGSPSQVRGDLELNPQVIRELTHLQFTPISPVFPENLFSGARRWNRLSRKNERDGSSLQIERNRSFSSPWLRFRMCFLS